MMKTQGTRHHNNLVIDLHRQRSSTVVARTTALLSAQSLSWNTLIVLSNVLHVVLYAV